MNSLTDKEINRASDGIDKALSTATRSNRGEVAFRILSVVRNLNDHIAFKIWKDVRPDQKMDINKVASKFGNVRPYQFIARFDHFLRASVSHFTPSEEGAERLMIKYYRYLLQLKKAVYDRYGMIILRNIDMFLEDLDEQTKDYYQKVATEIEKRLRTPPPKNFDNYYIDKIKPFFVNQEIYYEVALEPADEKPNKFNRITAFTKYDISTDYCVALSFSNATISVFNTDFPIKIITEWHVSIRPCELNNFAELLNVECSVSRGLNEYKMVMSYLEQNGATLVDIIDYDQREYDSIKNWVIASTQKRHSYIFDMLDICREISANKRDGANIIRYLLCRMSNRIIKDQQARGDEKRYAGLNISSKCMPFDRNPYSFNPKGHISNLYDLFECIDTAGHQGELLARYIEKNTNQNGVLFTPIDQLTMFGMPQEIEQTIEKYNRSLYSGFRPASELGVFKDYVYSKGCEIATVQIINKLEELADNVPAISSSFSEEMISQLKLLPAGQRLDDEVKEQILKTLFSESAVHLIYGAAGTGKTTLVNHISKLLEGKKKIYLAKTNPAVENLRRKVTCCDRSDEFTTIDKFVRSGWYETSNYDLVVVDECSTVKNEDILKVINRAEAAALLLVGDTYQIEAIGFGNWFSIIRNVLPDRCCHELTIPHRSPDEQLQRLWEEVRNMPELGGMAKAMVITASRQGAVKYRQAFENYTQKKGYTDIKALVAFSGKVKLPDDDTEYSEASMNGFPEDRLTKEFDKDDYQVLLVANKYQTGFDQPKLCAMYVLKKLKGVSAVQTLSRLNRICPPFEKKTFVLDFVNTYEDIKAAFAPYYTTTLLSTSVTPTAIYDLEAQIDAYTVLDPDDIEKANELLYKGNISSKDKQKLTFYFKRAKNRIEQYELIKQHEIVSMMRHFVRFYEFLLQVSCFEDTDLHKKYNFITYLLAYINIKHPGGGYNLDGKIKATNFVQKKSEEHTTPNLVAQPVVKLPTAESFGLTEAKEERLSQIIAEINSRTGKAYDNDVAVKAMLQIRDILLKSDKLKTSARNNTVKDFEFSYFDDIDDALIEGLEQNQDFFSLLLSNDEIKRQVLGIFTDEIYKSLREA